MSIEPQHDLAASATPFTATIADFASRGWTVHRTTVGRRELIAVAGVVGVLVIGEEGVESRTLHTRAGEICAQLPADLRRHVRVVEPGEALTVAELPAVLTPEQVDATTAAITAESDGDALTIAKVLEWTRHAKPEPARTSAPSRLSGAAQWITRHALIFAVIALGVAMLSIVGLGTHSGHSMLLEATGQHQQVSTSTNTSVAPGNQDR